MKKLLLVVSIVLLVAGCSKSASQNDENMDNEGVEQIDMGNSMISRYRASIYKEPELKTWVATLSKAERVNVLEEIDGEQPLARVQLSDGTEGYIKSNLLATKAVVIVKDGTVAYNRNNMTSGQVGVIPAGVIAMVVEEMGEWMKVSIGELPDGTKIYNRWIKEGYSDDQSLLADAAMYEYSMDILNGKAKGDESVARKTLEGLSTKGTVISDLATAALSGSSVQAYEYPDGSELTKVLAGSSLKLRSEPSTDASELTVIPGGATVAVLEVTGEEIELSGKTGKWTKINYKGQIGWAFGGFLE